MKPKAKSILCVDENDDNREIMSYLFEEKGFEVTACETLEECLSQARRKSFSAIILDNHFGDEVSLELCREIRSLNPKTPIVFYSGEAREEEIEKALAAGANEYLVKPLGIYELIDVVLKLIEENRTAA